MLLPLTDVVGESWERVAAAVGERSMEIAFARQYLKETETQLDQ